MNDKEFIAGVREAIGLWTEGGPKREALDIIADLLDKLPSPRLCAHCKEAVGDSYAQDIPNVGDLCSVCHKIWSDPGYSCPAPITKPKPKPERDKHGHFQGCYSQGCNASKCGTTTPPPLRNPFNEGSR